jgi:2-polyprenyl-3-methyl-5-hydroxy-6-metoxy-1,4-benzoquinol methylase
MPHASVYRCTEQACRLQFAHPQPTEESLAEAYAEAFSEAGAAQHHGSTPEPFARVLVDSLAAGIGPLAGRRILDFGAGIGTVTGLLVEAGADLVAVELDAAGRDKIRAKFAVPVVADLEQLHTLDDRRPFDVIVMVEVIEHLRDPRTCLVGLREFLREGGYLFVTTPNVASLKSRLQRASWPNRAMMTHLVYFEQRSLRAILQGAGFTNIRPVPGAFRHPGVSLPRKLLQRVLYPLGLHGGLQFLARRAR